MEYGDISSQQNFLLFNYLGNTQESTSNYILCTSNALPHTKVSELSGIYMT